MSEQAREQTRAKIDSVEDQEKYLVYRKSEIVSRLLQLQKNRSLVTANFAGHSFITALVDVHQDTGEVVLDVGADKELNEKLLQSKRTFFSAQIDGIRAQFRAEHISMTDYQGEPAFIMPMPKEFLWVQRRGAYRIKLPVCMTAKCKLSLGGSMHNLEVIDISITGVALKLPQSHEGIEIGSVIPNSYFHLSSEDNFVADVEVRNIFPLNKDDSAMGHRIGCVFINTNTDTAAMLQRFIADVEREKRRFEDDDEED
ncbi:MAG: hypothetical protein BMS9Abin26_2155 [Gammaproteobacteria bacterium]|nr:MAG: hypothetical protein BMS9Abin26_2155 [Gammaproteobacteria bacterium]